MERRLRKRLSRSFALPETPSALTQVSAQQELRPPRNAFSADSGRARLLPSLFLPATSGTYSSSVPKPRTRGTHGKRDDQGNSSRRVVLVSTLVWLVFRGLTDRLFLPRSPKRGKNQKVVQHFRPDPFSKTLQSLDHLCGIPAFTHRGV